MLGENSKSISQTTTLPIDSSNLRNRNAVWCSVLVQQLVNHGIHDVILCMGGRAAALGAVLNSWPGIKILSVTDERAAAFYALGLAKVSNRPVAICTTSGSAVANLMPALVEAKACGTPLVLLTCDRPRTVRRAGAPQCADHMGICQSLVEAALDLPDPGVSLPELNSLRQEVGQLLEILAHPSTCGPVHINLPQHGTLASTDPEPAWVAPVLPLSLFAHDVASQRLEKMSCLDEFNLDTFGLRPNMRGLIFVGPDAPMAPSEIALLARATGFPVFADFPSGLRRPQTIPTLICNGDLLLTSRSVLGSRPELIIRIGDAPVSSLIQRYLQAQSCCILVLTRHTGQDYLSPTSIRLVHPSTILIEKLTALLRPGNFEWCHHWLAQAARVQTFHIRHMTQLPWGECKAAWMICNAEGFDLFHAANSMSIRHANLYCMPRTESQITLVNRGVSGIDGTISTFFGAIHGSEVQGLLLIGDQAFAHDLSALQFARQGGMRGVVCVMNNGGSAIFDLLSCSALPDYVSIIRSDPGNRIDLIAAAFNISYVACHDAQTLVRVLASASSSKILSIVEIFVGHDSLKRDVALPYIELEKSSEMRE